MFRIKNEAPDGKGAKSKFKKRDRHVIRERKRQCLQIQTEELQKRGFVNMDGPDEYRDQGGPLEDTNELACFVLQGVLPELLSDLLIRDSCSS